MFLFSGLANRKVQVSILAAAFVFVAAIWPALSVTAGIPGIPTTTTLVLSASSVTSGTVVTLTASVSGEPTGASRSAPIPGGPAVTLGTVTFCDATAAFCVNSAVIGTAQLTSGGTAVIKFIPAIGSHSYKAIFSASNGNLASASTAQPLTVTGLYGSVTSILAAGSAGAYTLTGTVAGLGSTAFSPAGGSLSFIDTTNANTVVGSGTLGAATLAQAFAPRVNYGTGNAPQLLATGDFNGDGKVDLVVTNITDDTVSVFLGNGDGTFQNGVTYQTGAIPYSVAVGDFNGDGKLDLAVSNIGGDSVSILLGNGNGTFQDPVSYPVGSGPLTIAVGDMNGDGRLDVVVVDSGDATVSVLLGNGDGTFQDRAIFGTGTSASALALGDFNGDGIIDVVVVDQSGNTMSVLIGNGDGSLQSPVQYTVGNGPQAVIAGDFNGDGILDLVAVNSVDNTVSVLLGVGDGTFNPQVTYATGSAPFAVAVGDVNGDGFADLVILNNQSSTVSVLLGVGDGTFQPQVSYATGGGPTGLLLADLDGDGFPDVMVANDNDNTVSVLLNRITQTTAVAVSGVSVTGTGSAHLVAASYPGDTNFSPSISATTSLSSSPVATSLVLTANVGSTTYGQSVTLRATLNPSASGSLTTTGETVTFKLGAATLGTGTLNGLGVATLTLTTLPAGTDTMTAVYPGDTSFLTSTSTAFSFTVSQAVLTVTANNASRIYGAANPAFTAGFSGFVNGDTQITATTGVPSLTTAATAASPVTTYPITAAIGSLASGNYSFVFVNGVLTVNQAVLTVTANNLSKAYGAAIPALSAAITGFVNGDTPATATTGAPSLSTTATVASPVATYPITPTVGTLASTNYSFTFVAGVLTVNQAVLTVTANSVSKTYGAANPALTATLGGFVNGDTQLSATTGAPTLTTTATAASPVATYPITATIGTLASTNYSFTFVAGVLTVNQAVLTVTANNASKTYGAANPALTATLSGFVNGDTQLTSTTGAPTLATTATAASPVATYPITAAIGSLASTNYSFTFVAGVLTVNQAVLTVTANNASRIYGAANPALTATISGFVNGDTQLSATTGAPSLTTTATAASPVATYPITAAIGTLASTNYSFTFVAGVLTVNQAVLTVTANSVSRAYGAANPAFTATFTGFVNGDTQLSATTGAPTLTTPATAASPVATYPITATIGTLASTNYSFTFVAGVLTVNQAVLTVTANNASRTYGAANPVFTAAITGFLNGDTQATATTGAPSLATSATAASPVATYPITATIGTLASTNYSFLFVNGVLTVGQAVLTVTANNAGKIYGAANPVLTATFSGFLNGDTQATSTTGSPSLVTTATVASPVGGYPITASVGTLASTNYSFVFVNGTLTVSAAVITVTANNASRIYGAANPAFTATLTGFVNGDTQGTATAGAPTITTTALVTSPVATYPIAPAIGTLTAANYTFAFVNGTLTVTQAVLTVTANNASRVFGAANPVFTAAFTGFVNGDTQGTATAGAPSLTTTATAASPVATYPITSAVGTLTSTNYSFTFVNGVLTVSQATSIITWVNPAAITFGTALTATQLNATANTAGSFVYVPVAGTIPGAGSVTLSVTFTPTDVIDFAGATASVTLTVNKATPVITWAAPAAIVHGTPLSATQLNATASVPGSFVYNPAAGVVLAGGTSTLTVTFTPTDSADYNTATATVSLMVSDISIASNGAATETINAGQTAVFQLIVAPVGTPTFTSPVTFSISGLPAGASFSTVPITVPAGSGATAVSVMIQTTFFASTWNDGPKRWNPGNQLLALSLLIFALMLVAQLSRNRRKLTPQLLAVLLFAAPCLAAVVGVGGCSSLGANSGRSFPLIVTETSGTQQHTIALTLVIDK